MFASDSRLSYRSASSPVTYQPQHIRLLSDVNVFGGHLMANWLPCRMLCAGCFSNGQFEQFSSSLAADILLSSTYCFVI